MLDIIIPAYKDIEGLKRTLTSLRYDRYQHEVTVTVIDDCSGVNYHEVVQEFPDVIFHTLPENRGPGFARQYGIEHTHQPYIFFIDCGDILVSKYSIQEILDIIQEYPDYYLFLFQWITGNRKVTTKLTRSTQGWLYRRSFLDHYNIKFCLDPFGTRADEDVGFNHTCTTLIKYMELRDHKRYSLFIPVPIYRLIPDDNSITHTGNYGATKHIPGLVINATHCIRQLEKTDIDKDTLIEEISIFMFSLYRDFINHLLKYNDHIQTVWEKIRQYYFEVYKPYENEPEMEIYLSQNITRFMPSLRKIADRPNIRKFIRDLNEHEFYPTWYYGFVGKEKISI